MRLSFNEKLSRVIVGIQRVPPTSSAFKVQRPVQLRGVGRRTKTKRTMEERKWRQGRDRVWWSTGMDGSHPNPKVGTHANPLLAWRQIRFESGERLLPAKTPIRRPPLSSSSLPSVHHPDEPDLQFDHTQPGMAEELLLMPVRRHLSNVLRLRCTMEEKKDGLGQAMNFTTIVVRRPR